MRYSIAGLITLCILPSCGAAAENLDDAESELSVTRPALLPGRIEAELFREGGEGVGYHDTTEANRGQTTVRNGAVDIQSTNDEGGGYHIGWMQPGEWLAYDIDVSQPGTYSLTARVAANSTASRSFYLDFDGQRLPSTQFSSRAGWQEFINVSAGSIELTQGKHSMKFVAETEGFNLNYFDVSLLDKGRLMRVGAATQSVSGESAAETWDHLENDLGVALPIRRSFSPGFPATFAAGPAAIDVGHRDSVYSFKAAWASVAAGSYDRQIADLVKSIPAGHKTWLCYFHEPENDSGNAADYRNGFARFADIVKRTREAKPIIVTQILMGWTWDSKSGRNPNDWVVADAEVVGIDSYGGQCGNRTPIAVFGPAVSWLKSHNRRWAVAETGCEEKAGETQKRVQWTTDAFRYIYENGAEFATWWDSACDDGCDYRIRTSPEGTAAFAKVVRKYAYGEGL